MTAQAPNNASTLLAAIDVPQVAQDAAAAAAAQPAADAAAQAAAPAADAAAAAAAAPAVAAPEPTPAPAAAPAPLPTDINLDQLAAIVPQVSRDQLAGYVAPLNAALAHAGIDSPLRKAAFISQLVVESDSFRTFEEYASGSAYEGRSDLGNTQPGDGTRYKGRGAIQVTGRHNYEQVSQYTGIDFIANPELMASPENAFSTAAWYWTSRNLNGAADTAGIEKVSRLVNGGTHGLAQRIDSFTRGLAVLGAP
ncbi:hypothetical protein HCA44_13320 [Rhodococcus sp. HNM0569]|nr:glycoside hydrolase family 19 protein [Rhodococcus sp. HNM0569]NLU83756.1 hypothetical protein [Rhodococcus sp. HNM0569]